MQKLFGHTNTVDRSKNVNVLFNSKTNTFAVMLTPGLNSEVTRTTLIPRDMEMVGNTGGGGCIGQR